MRNYWIQYRNDFCLTKGNNPAPRQIAAAPVEQKSAPLYISPSVQYIIEEQDAADVSTLLIKSDIHDPRLAPVFQGHKVNSVAFRKSPSEKDFSISDVYSLFTQTLQ